jgi:hypothetical protein
MEMQKGDCMSKEKKILKYQEITRKQKELIDQQKIYIKNLEKNIIKMKSCFNCKTYAEMTQWRIEPRCDCYCYNYNGWELRSTR